RLDVTGITIPANGSVSIVYEVTIAGSAVAGTTIDNTAEIHNPDGADKVVSAATIRVAESGIVQSGDKYLYLRNESTITRKLSRSPPATSNGIPVAINGAN